VRGINPQPGQTISADTDDCLGDEGLVAHIGGTQCRARSLLSFGGPPQDGKMHAYGDEQVFRGVWVETRIYSRAGIGARHPPMARIGSGQRIRATSTTAR
jgi:hypothetical protein